MSRLAKTVPGAAAILPMDGYHYDDLLLEARGDRPRKGASHTFDVDGFHAMLTRLAANDGRDVVVPVFDRSFEIARISAPASRPEQSRPCIPRVSARRFRSPSIPPVATASSTRIRLNALPRTA